MQWGKKGDRPSAGLAGFLIILVTHVYREDDTEAAVLQITSAPKVRVRNPGVRKTIGLG